MKPTSLFIYDDDVVEYVNMSGQLYSKSNIGIVYAHCTYLSEAFHSGNFSFPAHSLWCDAI